MKAIAKTSPAPGLAVIEVPEPRPGPGEVLVEVKASGICGTDLHVYRSELGFGARLGGFPRIIGHEPAGVVRAVGPGVTEFRPGDCVVGDPHGACGRCPVCRAGRPELCERIPVLGAQRDGALAELVAAPAECLHHIPEDLDFTLASLLEPLTVGVHAVDLAGLRPGERAVVLGPGPIGLMTALAARAAGAAGVVVTGLGVDAARLATAGELGFPAVDVEADRPVERIQAALGARGAAVVFDATGALPDAHRLVARGGRVVLIGWPCRAPSLDEVTQLFLKTVTVTPLRMRPESIWPRTIELVRTGRIDPRPLISHMLPLVEGLRGFELALRREAVKVQLIP